MYYNRNVFVGAIFIQHTMLEKFTSESSETPKTSIQKAEERIKHFFILTPSQKNETTLIYDRLSPTDVEMIKRLLNSTFDPNEFDGLYARIAEHKTRTADDTLDKQTVHEDLLEKGITVEWNAGYCFINDMSKH